MDPIVAACVSVVRSNHQIIRRRARMRRLLAMCSQIDVPIYATPSSIVPPWERYLDQTQDLRRDYRLTRTTIQALMDLLRREKTHGWGQEMEILMVLYWLAHGLSYRLVSNAFEMPRSTVCDLVHRVCDAILTLLDRVIGFPLPEQCPEIGSGFQHLAGSPAFGRCAGAIGVCHIPIKASHPGAAPDYLNRKRFHSILLQGICDSTGKLLDIFVGYPGSVPELKVLKNSPVFVGGIYPPSGYFIVGDGGYPCINTPIALLTPYHKPLQGSLEACFNARHAKACVIEKAFGMMKARWRGVFFKALEVSTTFAPKVAAVCAILHNLAVTNGDIVEPAVEEPWPSLDPPPPEGEGAKGGRLLRQEVAEQVSASQHWPLHLKDHDYD
ncbi:PREDICTED: putative nuclease HARBI1 [Cyprinodon variegatus]|uniref:Putative nuclease HARBI1 n=1 Tax=Cyprinodon variegatus TaxID=28743 RepID=A0A3Q2E7L8_CYPVA|nr:PREDICTED: putative nuclease HARBI1 [Cyprinodon variegatus]